MNGGKMEKSDLSGLKEGKQVKFRDACDYVSQPKGAYGTKSGLQPSKARTKFYTPDDKAPKNR